MARIKLDCRVHPEIFDWLTAEAERKTKAGGGTVRQGGMGRITVGDVIQELVIDRQRKKRQAKK